MSNFPLLGFHRHVLTFQLAVREKPRQGVVESPLNGVCGTGAT